MKLTEMTIKDYMALLASSEPAPGGGSASALMGSQGAGLTAMVCALTIGKKKYLEHEELCKKVQEKTLKLKDQLLKLIDRDTEAFNAISDVFSMPKETDEEKAARKAAMQKALLGATKTPFEMMEAAYEALKQTESIVGKSNQSAASDLGVSALCLKAAIQGAWLNVLINISGIQDEAFVDKYRKAGEKLLKEALPLADRIYEAIQAAL